RYVRVPPRSHANDRRGTQAHRRRRGVREGSRATAQSIEGGAKGGGGGRRRAAKGRRMGRGEEERQAEVDRLRRHQGRDRADRVSPNRGPTRADSRSESVLRGVGRS